MLDEQGKELVASSLRLVHMVVGKHNRLFPIIPRDELEGICYLALCQAAERWPTYCEEHGYNRYTITYFNPYAYRRMNGAINDKLREMDPLTRAQRKKVKEEDSDMSSIPGNMVGGYLLAPDSEMLNAVSDKQPTSHSQILVQNVLDKLVEFFKEQPYRTQVIIALYYYKEMMLQDVAELLGVTESSVSKAHSEFIVEARHRLLDYLQ